MQSEVTSSFLLISSENLPGPGGGAQHVPRPAQLTGALTHPSPHHHHHHYIIIIIIMITVTVSLSPLSPSASDDQTEAEAD